MLHTSVKRSSLGRKYIHFFIGYGLLITICYLLVTALLFQLDLPEIYQDAVTKDCIAVVTAQSVVPCEGNVPVRYVPVPVDPKLTFNDIAASMQR
jgi:hypothetical protein